MYLVSIIIHSISAVVLTGLATYNLTLVNSAHFTWLHALAVVVFTVVASVNVRAFIVSLLLVIRDYAKLKIEANNNNKKV